MEPLDVQGEFWLAEAEDQKVAGRLTFDQDGGGRLQLIGAFGDPSGITMSPSNHRIHGDCNGKRFTLEDCFETSRSANYPSSKATSKYVVNQIYAGALFANGSGSAFTKMDFGLQDLTAWVGISGLDNDLGEPVAMSATTLDKITIPVTGYDLELWHGTAVKPERFRSITASERHRFTISFNSLTPYAEFMDRASDLQDLVSLGFGKPAPFENPRFIHPELSGMYDDTKRYRKIDVYARWHAKHDPDAKVPSAYDMAFTFSDIGGAEGIAAWMNVAASHRGALGRIMATRHQMFVEDRFLNLVSAAEGFHRKRTGQQNRDLAKRLTNLVDLAGDPFTAALPRHDEWVRWVTAERVDLAHHFERRPQREGSIHHYMAESVYWLLTLCLLREAEMPDDAFSRLAANREFTHVMERATEVLHGSDSPPSSVPLGLLA